ncbi:MAG: murein L,D-transpeptidase catalytic domain family protein [Sphingomonadaceae bacterium]|nr:murein L,D-transpeptidase catalytic domain family protein [Sphingomonadaceae bacterium]
MAAAGAAAGFAAMPARAFVPSFAGLPSAASGLKPALLGRALGALQRHAGSVANHGTIGIVDFSAHSSSPRFHLVDVESGRTTSLLVAHGRGSDPDRTGFVQHFSNADGSNASSMGAYLTGDIYDGKHGRSRRLFGLDSSNSNVERRSIVVHSAWYVGPEVLRANGQLGRSEGCFAVSPSDLALVLDRLGPGHMIYADKA